MYELALDPLAYNSLPRHHKRAKHYRGHPQPSTNKTERREAIQTSICLCCVLPRCIPHGKECPLQSGPGLTTSQSGKKRRGLAHKHRRGILRLLRTHPGATCPEIAAELHVDEADIYGAMVTLILDEFQPIRPTSLRDGAAVYQLEKNP